MIKTPSKRDFIRRATWGFLVAALLLGPGSTNATADALKAPGTTNARHPVSVVEADILVTKTKITMRIKAFAEDLELLQGIEPMDDGFYDSDELVDATEEHAEYLLEHIDLITSDGSRLEGRVVDITHFEIPDEGIRQGELMNYTMGFTLEYPLDQAPEFLTINQRMISDLMLLPSELKVLLKQAGSDQPFMKMMKPNQPETFQFDWENPPLPSDASDEDWESWFAQQREKNLGIESYSSVYSFIYITNFQVRHEVLIPLATLATFLDIERADPAYLDIPEQDAAAEKIKAFFSSGNPVEIDGVVVEPVFDRIDFYGLDLRDFAVRAQRRKVNMFNGRVGVIMSYSTKGMPQQVKVTWDIFNESLKTVDTVVIAFDKVEKTQFSMFLADNTYVWTAANREPPPPINAVTDELAKYQTPKLRISLVSALLALLAFGAVVGPLFGCCRWRWGIMAAVVLAVSAWATSGVAVRAIDSPWAAAPQVPDERADQIFAQLHKNIFRAFDYHSEDQVYDALARSVDGDLLRTLYLQIIESLRIKEQGGAISHIQEVRIVEGQRIEPPADLPVPDRPAFGYRAKWELIGTVEHWGHIHQRTNQYDAEFVVQLLDDGWKITSMQILDESQGPVVTSQRTY